jgi:large conductance mechanosensitive channel
MQAMLKGFKDFLMRGNVVDLAVAVVVGSAFSAVVNTLVSSIIKPLLNAAGNPKTGGLGFSLRGGALEKATFVDVSAIVNAAIVFVLTSAVVYFLIVMPMNHLAERRKRGLEPEVKAPAEDVALLREIRDLLATRDVHL